MTSKEYPEQKTAINHDVVILTIEVENPEGGKVTTAQMDAARNAAAAVFEITGANVVSTAAPIGVDFPELATAARLTIKPTVEFLEVGEKEGE